MQLTGLHRCCITAESICATRLNTSVGTAWLDGESYRTTRSASTPRGCGIPGGPIHRPLAARASEHTLHAGCLIGPWSMSFTVFIFFIFFKFKQKSNYEQFSSLNRKIEIWTIFKLKTKIEIWKKFKNLKYKQFSKMNIFHIWTFFVYEQIQNMNNFQIWTKFIYEHFLYINKFHIWTFFIYKQIWNMNNFQVWTKNRKYEQFPKYE
jgi:hypothetical protein